MLLHKLLMFVFVLGAAATAVAQGRVECSAIKSAILNRPVRYCALLPPSFDSNKARRFPILYFLHGLGDNEQSLVNSGAWSIAERLRKSGGIGDMLIVTPDGDRSFYINSRDGRVRYEDFFLREFVPAIERRYRALGTRQHRGVAGVSMGGYGALRMAFKHPAMFAAVSTHMAAVYEKLPSALKAASAAGDPRVRSLDAGGVFGTPTDEAFWQQNNPVTLARAHAPELRKLRIYFDCGDRDDYGFDSGTRALDRLLSAERVPHEFHIYPGGHDWTYVAAHFGDALRFQWQAIAPQVSAGKHGANLGHQAR